MNESNHHGNTHVKGRGILDVSFFFGGGGVIRDGGIIEDLQYLPTVS
jgi:hypothetical protein